MVPFTAMILIQIAEVAAGQGPWLEGKVKLWGGGGE